MQNSKIRLEIQNQILIVTFLRDAVISKADLEEIYTYADNSFGDKRYGIIFTAKGHYDINEDAIPFMVNNPHSARVFAKCYVIDSKEADTKTRLHLRFDRPSQKPLLFRTLSEAITALNGILSSPL